MPWAIKDTNNDVTREKCLHGDKGNLTLSGKSKLHGWKDYFLRLLNVEFPCDKNSLNNSAAVQGLGIFLGIEMVTDAIKKMEQ